MKQYEGKSNQGRKFYFYTDREGHLCDPRTLKAESPFDVKRFLQWVAGINIGWWLLLGLWTLR